MLIAAQHLSKTIGSKTLFTDLDIHIGPKEKVALIGRNGEGKSTLMNILGGIDTDFQGEIVRKKNLRTILTRQEHLTDNKMSALEYILDSVPHYTEYEKVLADFEKGHHEDLHLYTTAMEYFSENGYYYIKDLIMATLADFQIDNETAKNPLVTLSGGEKRFVELARMMYSQAELLLIDEPTNHMDYVGKEQFIAWMSMVEEGILVVTHDRDVLSNVDRIIELKDKTISSYKGNYDAYLTQNTAQTTNSVILYQNQLKKLKEAKERVTWGLQMRAKSKAWKIRYDHWVKDYEKIKAETVKPSFWIDQESVEGLDKRVTDSYHKFKEKNVNIAIPVSTDRISELVAVKDLSLGYDHPLFTGKAFKVGSEDRVFIKGRNGAGKSTLVRTIMSQYKDEKPAAKLYDGQIKVGSMTRIGEYEQEINSQYLPLTLEVAVHKVYEEHDIPADREMVMTTLSRYLFDAKVDSKIKVENLSGGQKARFQLIKMFANKPNLLILDEPTNHLDLPSIEELENALLSYTGGILYISHDSSFIKKLVGEVIEI
ncbi:ABC-F family ATP-binding cassette domain-containing protein [Candidatus Woesebacteria bacterium]|nr:ABC-F family ATP-binding cassette domain-containing protein [Candidatus Woesebacteria bacterium]